MYTNHNCGSGAGDFLMAFLISQGHIIEPIRMYIFGQYLLFCSPFECTKSLSALVRWGRDGWVDEGLKLVFP